MQNVRYLMHEVQCVQNSTRNKQTMHNVQHSMAIHDVQCSTFNMQIVKCAMFNVCKNLIKQTNNAQCSTFNGQYTMFNVQRSICNEQCNLFNVQCSMFNVQCVQWESLTQSVAAGASSNMLHHRLAVYVIIHYPYKINCYIIKLLSILLYIIIIKLIVILSNDILQYIIIDIFLICFTTVQVCIRALKVVPSCHPG